MSDEFTTQEEAEAYARGLAHRMLRSLVLEPAQGEATWRVISPDLDYKRTERVWESAEHALSERL